MLFKVRVMFINHSVFMTVFTDLGFAVKMKDIATP